MIIKIDHITICSTDFESDLNYFSNLGFKPSILNRKLKNLKIKNALMKCFCKYQKFALLESKNNLDVEILGYDNVNSGTPYIEPDPPKMLTPPSKTIVIISNSKPSPISPRTVPSLAA